MLEISTTKFKKSDLKLLGRLFLTLFRTFRLIDLKEDVGENGEYIECNNLTLINFTLKCKGPTHEATLTSILIGVQVR